MLRLGNRAALLTCTVLTSAVLVSEPAYAQGTDAVGLEEIIVTAQKREQSVQDVPISITALTGDTIQANRVVSVIDLSGLAPGLTVRPAAGGSSIPSFTVRGAVSYGVVPGSDKQVSVYLDGVYISSPRGSIFDLPDVSRIEMLRGPQGTLFGRNATAGAVSVSTRDPSGKAHLKVQGTVGNYDQYRFRISADLPAIGPFSAYGTYVRTYKRGDIFNASAGQVWDRTPSSATSSVDRVRVSPQYLGTIDTNSYFGSIKFEPSYNFKTVYKVDYSEDNGTPEGTGYIGYNINSPLTGPLLAALTGPGTGINIAPDGKRPTVVNNSFTVPRVQTVLGHSVTSTWQISDSFSAKNIFAYRKSHVFAAVPIDGFGAVPFTAAAIVPYATFIAFSTLPPANAIAAIPTIAGQVAPLVGQPFVGVASQPDSYSKQWSDELQINYTSSLMEVTVGGLWFKSRDSTSGPLGLQNTYSFAPLPGGVLTPANIGYSKNRATSLAIYGQAEVHVTSKLDIVLGGRITKDDKSGTFEFGNSLNALTVLPFTYKKTKPSYLVGVNYQPSDHTLLYAKFSTAFVSGGSVAGIAFEPETVSSWEAGFKTDLFDRRVRTNLSIYSAEYKNVQTAQGSSTFPEFLSNINGRDLSRVISTFILSQGGPVRSKGFEFELTAKPVRAVTLGGSLGYADTKFIDVNPVLVASSGGQYVPTLRPDWTAGLWGEFESQPFAGDMRVAVRADANWRDTMALDSNPNRGIAAFAAIVTAPSTWIVNSRAALKGIKFGDVNGELAVWAKNITNDRTATFGLILGTFAASANYQPARTFGLDLQIEF